MKKEQSETVEQRRFNRSANWTIAGAVCLLAIILFAFSAFSRVNPELNQDQPGTEDDVLIDLNLNNPQEVLNLDQPQNLADE